MLHPEDLLIAECDIACCCRMDTAPRQCSPLAIHVAESVRLIRGHIRKKASDTGFHFREC